MGSKTAAPEEGYEGTDHRDVMQLDVRVEVLDGNFARGDDDGARDSEKQHREGTVDGVQLGGHVEARAHPRDLERMGSSQR